MKKVYLIRHSKAEEHNSAGDFSRSLTTQGKEDARKAGEYLHHLKINPDVVFSSPAPRALATAKIIHSVAKFSQQINEKENLYMPEVNFIVKLIRQQEESSESLLIVSHNPGLCLALNFLCADSYERFPKTAIAGLTFNVNRWKEIGIHSGILSFFFSQKKFSTHLQTS